MLSRREHRPLVTEINVGVICIIKTGVNVILCVKYQKIHFSPQFPVAVPPDWSLLQTQLAGKPVRDHVLVNAV